MGRRPYSWLNSLSQKFLDQGYLLPGQSVEERVRVVAAEAERRTGARGLAERFAAGMAKGWYSLSTPVWTNFGTSRGLPISCYGTHVEDTTESIVRAWAEVAVMTKHGGGTAAYFGELRPRGAAIRDNGESSGSVHFMRLFEALIQVISQGSTRRGNFAAYLPVDHPDVDEFLRCRTEGSPVQDLSLGLCVPDAWLEAMVAGDAAKRAVWARVLEARSNTGYPYLFFTDNANRGPSFPDVYRDKGMRVRHSQLCSEVMLPTDAEESFVCCLSSMNDLYFDEWRHDPHAVEDLVCVLDAVLDEFVEKAEGIAYMERAVRFAKRHRAVGVGRLGWHSKLQSDGIPFESAEAKHLNVLVSKVIKERAYAASARLAGLRGEPELLKGYGRRHATLVAIAPTKSSSFILGQASEGVEPEHSNYQVKDLAKGKYTLRNRYLEALLRRKGLDREAVWDDVLGRGGSVQHLTELSEEERAVFKTFGEISQREVVLQAAGRQRHVDQGQSVNLMVAPDVPARDLNALVLEAWRLGLKSLYYQVGVNAAQAFSLDVMRCSSCEA